MKTCIWCKKNENEASFFKQAHTIPKSLGGKNICENVCDECNHYFGATEPDKPALEVVFKEMVNISKYLLLGTANKVPKNQRFKSTFFNVNWKTYVIRLKPKYSLKKGYQMELGRRFRRSMYKVFLEERERIKGDGLSDKFNFIREFSRLDKGDYPIFIQIPKLPAVFFSDKALLNPEIKYTKSVDQIEEVYKIHTFPLMGHNFIIPLHPEFKKKYLEMYLHYLHETDHAFGSSLREIVYAQNIDYTFSSVLNNQSN